jgi:hypothetical protein
MQIIYFAKKICEIIWYLFCLISEANTVFAAWFCSPKKKTLFSFCKNIDLAVCLPFLNQYILKAHF